MIISISMNLLRGNRSASIDVRFSKWAVPEAKLESIELDAGKMELSELSGVRMYRDFRPPLVVPQHHCRRHQLETADCFHKFYDGEVRLGLKLSQVLRRLATSVARITCVLGVIG